MSAILLREQAQRARRLAASICNAEVEAELLVYARELEARARAIELEPLNLK